MPSIERPRLLFQAVYASPIHTHCWSMRWKPQNKKRIQLHGRADLCQASVTSVSPSMPHSIFFQTFPSPVITTYCSLWELLEFQPILSHRSKLFLYVSEMELYLITGEFSWQPGFEMLMEMWSVDCPYSVQLGSVCLCKVCTVGPVSSGSRDFPSLKMMMT